MRVKKVFVNDGGTRKMKEKSNENREKGKEKREKGKEKRRHRTYDNVQSNQVQLSSLSLFLQWMKLNLLIVLTSKSRSIPRDCFVVHRALCYI
jgi:hypothetical protein